MVSSIYLVYNKIHIFHQLMKSLGYVLETNTHYFELTMQKENNYVGWKVVLLNFQLSYVSIFLLEIPKFVL